MGILATLFEDIAFVTETALGTGEEWWRNFLQVWFDIKMPTITKLGVAAAINTRRRNHPIFLSFPQIAVVRSTKITVYEWDYGNS